MLFCQLLSLFMSGMAFGGGLTQKLKVSSPIRGTKYVDTPGVWDTKDMKKEYNSNVLKDPNYKGIFRCRRCKSYKTTYYEMQTRSADEPMTVFITCHNCGSRWKS